jgi:hypothetical protein
VGHPTETPIDVSGEVGLDRLGRRCAQRWGCQPRLAASIVAISIFFICIIASNARLAASGSEPVSAFVKGDGRNLPGQSSFVLAQRDRPVAHPIALAVERVELKRHSLLCSGTNQLAQGIRIERVPIILAKSDQCGRRFCVDRRPTRGSSESSQIVVNQKEPTPAAHRRVECRHSKATHSPPQKSGLCSAEGSVQRSFVFPFTILIAVSQQKASARDSQKLIL